MISDEKLRELRKKADTGGRHEYPDLSDEAFVGVWAPVVCTDLRALIDALDEAIAQIETLEELEVWDLRQLVRQVYSLPRFKRQTLIASVAKEQRLEVVEAGALDEWRRRFEEADGLATDRLDRWGKAVVERDELLEHAQRCFDDHGCPYCGEGVEDWAAHAGRACMGGDDV